MSERIKVLMLEDNAADAELILHALRASDYDSDWKRVDGEAGFIAALSPDLDIILADYILPQYNALEALTALNQSGLDIPFVVITGTVSEDAAVMCMKQGAADYLMKDRLARLGQAVANALESRQLRAEKRQAEEALRISERRFRDMLDNVHLIALQLDMQGGITYINDYLLGITGYQREELSGKNWFDMMVPDTERERVRQVLTASLEQGHIVAHMQNGMLTRSGTLRTILWSNTVMRDDQGRVVGMASIGEDVTEQQQRVRELEVVATVGDGLRSAANSAAILPFMLGHLQSLLAVEAGAVILLDAASGLPVVAMGSGLWAEIGESGQVISTEMVDRVLSGGQPLVRQAGEVVESPCLLSSVLEGQAMASVPMISQEVPVGILCVARGASFRPDELRLLTLVANMTAGALHRSTLFEETQRRLRHMTTLHTISLAINGTLDLGIALNTLVDQMLSHLGVDASSVMLLDAYAHTLSVMVGRGFRTKDVVGNTRLRLGESLAGSAAFNRRPVWVRDIRQMEDLVTIRPLVEEGFISYYGIPLIAKGYVKGVLELFFRKEVSLDAELEDFLSTLAAEVALAIDNAALFESQQRSNLELSLAYEDTIEGWSRALDLRDKETEGHTQRVTEMTLRLAKAMGVQETDLLNIRRGALLHDIGKMGVPDAILHKPGPLTEDEWKVMKQHPTLAFSMLSPIQFLRSSLDIPYYHHERYDGSGYPLGLKGEMIPLVARIFAVVDVWDALLSFRSYRPAWQEADASEYIRAQAGKQFDPEVVRIFLALVGRG